MPTQAHYARGAVSYGNAKWPSYSFWMVPGCEYWQDVCLPPLR